MHRPFINKVVKGIRGERNLNNFTWFHTLCILHLHFLSSKFARYFSGDFAFTYFCWWMSMRIKRLTYLQKWFTIDIKFMLQCLLQGLGKGKKKSWSKEHSISFLVQSLILDQLFVVPWTAAAKVLELQLHHQSFQWIFRVVFYFRIDWFALLAVRLSRVFSSTTIWRHQFFDTQPSLRYNSHIHIWLVEKT